MNFSVVLSLLLASAASATNPFNPQSANDPKSKYTSKLVQNARPTGNSRRLGDDYEVDLTPYSVKFHQCQFVKAYDDELADDEESATVLATKRFVIFRLCKGDGDCSSCSYSYGEYLISLEEYLEATVEYQQELQQEMCNACEECGNNNNNNNNQDNGDDGGRRLQNYNVDCSTCYDECQKIENMEDNGYIDATEFIECQMIYDPEDDGADALYAGPMCASYGTKIKIGVFLDEDCNQLDASKDVDDYLQDGDGYSMKLSHALLKTVYSEDMCVSCLFHDEDQDQNNNDNDQNDNEVVDMCEQLYEMAAKCETQHGFEDGVTAYYGYSNQLAQEDVVCQFIDSIESGTYDEEGEILIQGSNSVTGGGSNTTGGQKFALTFFILGTVGLAVYAAMLHSKLTKGGKTDLSNQGGAMA